MINLSDILNSTIKIELLHIVERFHVFVNVIISSRGKVRRNGSKKAKCEAWGRGGRVPAVGSGSGGGEGRGGRGLSEFLLISCQVCRFFDEMSD